MHKKRDERTIRSLLVDLCDREGEKNPFLSKDTWTDKARRDIFLFESTTFATRIRTIFFREPKNFTRGDPEPLVLKLPILSNSANLKQQSRETFDKRSLYIFCKTKIYLHFYSELFKLRYILEFFFFFRNLKNCFFYIFFRTMKLYIKLL